MIKTIKIEEEFDFIEPSDKMGTPTYEIKTPLEEVLEKFWSSSEYKSVLDVTIFSEYNGGRKMAFITYETKYLE